MNLLRIAARVADFFTDGPTYGAQLIQVPDYGKSGAALPRGDGPIVPRGDASDDEKEEKKRKRKKRQNQNVSKVVKKDGEYCVVGEKKGWSGGCYDSEKAAHDRLVQVEMMKSINERKK